MLFGRRGEENEWYKDWKRGIYPDRNDLCPRDYTNLSELYNTNSYGKGAGRTVREGKC